MPAVLIAGSHSGAGKTTATGVLLRALVRRGLVVQPFKLGPDFIDPAYHAEAVGRPSINLDQWMMGADGMRRSFARWSADADVSVIEAMGGLYDGTDGTERGSAAETAKLLGVPVVVVLDVWGMTRTTGAILDGLRGFDPDLNLAGCVLNRVGSATHAQMVVDALPDRLRPLVVGTIEHRAELAVDERHLGLVTVEENAVADGARQAAQARAAATIDTDRVLRIAGAGRPARPAAGSGRATRPEPGPSSRVAGTRRAAHAVSAGAPPVARLALARDRAFSFWYEENLALLQEAGFALVPFQPTVDAQLPPDVDAVWIGGGYPESFAAELAANTTLAAELRDRVRDGMPLYAECGGLMYLARSLTGFDGVRHVMSGVLPLDVVMDPAHLAIRYVDVRTRAASLLGGAQTALRGQEFHQSRIAHADIEPTLYDVTASDGRTSRDGYLLGSVVASYVHVHLASNPAVARSFVRAAVEGRRAVAGA